MTTTLTWSQPHGAGASAETAEEERNRLLCAFAHYYDATTDPEEEAAAIEELLECADEVLERFPRGKDEWLARYARGIAHRDLGRGGWWDELLDAEECLDRLEKHHYWRRAKRRILGRISVADHYDRVLRKGLHAMIRDELEREEAYDRAI